MTKRPIYTRLLHVQKRHVLSNDPSSNCFQKPMAQCYDISLAQTVDFRDEA